MTDIDVSRNQWDNLTHEIRNMIQCSAQSVRELSSRCLSINDLLLRLSVEKRMLDWVPPVANPKVRVDKMGDGHFGASRGNRLHRGTDYLASPGDPVFMTLKDAKVI